MDIVKVFIEHKDSNNFTLGQIAMVTGLPKSVISKVCSQSVKPSTKTVDRLARFVLETLETNRKK